MYNTNNSKHKTKSNNISNINSMYNTNKNIKLKVTENSTSCYSSSKYNIILVYGLCYAGRCSNRHRVAVAGSKEGKKDTLLVKFFFLYRFQ